MPSAGRVRFLPALIAALTLTLLTPMTAQAAPVTAQGAKSSVSVLTFNVCGHAAGCRGWGQRETAIVQRIVASKADVVNVQEVWGVLDLLEQRLAPHGYVLAASSGNEGLFAKSSKVAPIATSATVTTCRRGKTYAGPEIDTSEWFESRSHVDENGVEWQRSSPYGSWYHSGDICTDQIVTTTKSGQILLGGRAAAAWAMLRVKKTGKTYVFVSTHLTTGKDSVAGKRSGETTRLLAASARVAEGRPRVFAGDFNSSIQRGKDTVGKRFTAQGFRDSYTRATSRRGAKYNSATGWGTKPRVGGSHIDRVFVPRGATATRWAMDVKIRGKKTVRPVPSDHSPIRVSIVLP